MLPSLPALATPLPLRPGDMVSSETESLRFDAVQTILIIKSDRIYAETLRQMTLQAFPRAAVTLALSAASASMVLANRRFDLLVAGLETSLGGDVLDLLANCAASHGSTPRVLVVTTHREFRLLAALRALLVPGVFDAATEAPEQLVCALKMVADGEFYWSRSLLDSIRDTASSQCLLTRQLTTAEQLVLTVIGDGSDDELAAKELGLSSTTIATVRRNLHRKLGAQHRGALMRIAAQHGFVRYTHSGVIRTGYTILANDVQVRKAKRPDLTAA